MTGRYVTERDVTERDVTERDVTERDVTGSPGPGLDASSASADVTVAAAGSPSSPWCALACCGQTAVKRQPTGQTALALNGSNSPTV